MSKELCSCGAVAVWDYMPGFSNGSSSLFCDDCVPRGCACNHRYSDVNAYHPPLEKPDLPDGEEGKDWKWVSEGVWCHIDEKGREYPCVEYMYDEDGWDI
jgi:hypothetical protein